MSDCKHATTDVTVLLARSDEDVVAAWCRRCGSLTVVTPAGEWGEWEWPRVALTKHLAIHSHEALCGNLFGERTASPREMTCVPCGKRAWQYVGVWLLEGVEHLLGFAVVRRLGR